MHCLRVFKIIYYSPVILVLSLLVGVKTSSAQIPKPYVECDEIRKPEWNSLRPYQASPCIYPINMEEQSLLCGNDLIVRDTFPAPYEEGQYVCPWCGYTDPKCDCVVTCKFTVDRKFDIFINAYDSELPIAGLTENLPPKDKGDLPLPKEVWRLTDWLNQDKLPPDREKYSNFLDYYLDIRRWRGSSCPIVKIPIVNISIFLCYDNPLSPNFWATLFPNVPYSSTEDRIGKLTAYPMQVLDSGGMAISGPVTNWHPKPRPDDRNALTGDNESVLYFAHMEEDVELSSLLQTTYAPPEILEKEQPIGTTVPVPQNEINNFCRIVETRSNPGDQLFGETMNNRGVPQATVEYIAKFTCTCVTDGFGRICKRPCCIKSAAFNSKIETYTPMIDELWSKTVSGNASIFKRIYPKTGEDPVKEIKDIPAESKVDHDSETNLPGNVITLSSPAEMYFPHLGGIYDYFLKGIQKALRPQEIGSRDLELIDNTPIYDPEKPDEYISWFLNGTLYRAENYPVDVESEIGQVVDYTGPLNKLLAQESQWRNEFKQATNPPRIVSKVGQIEERAKVNRHDQIVGCTISKTFTIPIVGISLTLGGYPTLCDNASVPDATATTSPSSTPTSANCPYSTIPNMTTSPECVLTHSTIGAASIPPLMKRVFEAAGAKYNVPPDLIAGVMYAEGGFEPRTIANTCYGEPDGGYTESVVENAVKCEFLNCNPDKYNPPCNYNSNQGPGSCTCGGTHFGPYQQCPCGYNPCNFYDATMNAAEKLSRDRYGLSSYPAGQSSCLGINYNTGSIGGSVSCQKSAWTCSDVITAIRFEAGSCIDSHFCNVLSVYGACNSGC